MIRRTNSFEIEAYVKRLKQHDREVLASYRFSYDPEHVPESMTLAYSIVSASLPDRINGQLHLVVG